MNSAVETAKLVKDVFVLPESITRLKACMDDSAASIEDVGMIISLDPSLSAQILKVANSAMYKFPNQITTLSKALQVIGTRSAYDLALAYGISQAFKDVEAKAIDLDRFWEQSVSCGLLAKYIGEQKKHRESERLFLSGLLHNIGELVIASQAPKIARRCATYNSQVTPADLQCSICGFTYAELSAELLKLWGIPATIYEPITAIHDKHSGENLEVNIVRLAYVLALDNAHQDIYPSYNNLRPDLLRVLELDYDDLEDALDITNLQCLSVLSLFNPSAFILY